MPGDFIRLADYIIEFGGGPDLEYIDARVHENLTYRLVMNNGNLVSYTKDRDSGIGIRIFSKGVLLHESHNIASRDHIDRLLEKMGRRISLLSSKLDKRIPRYELHPIREVDIEYSINESKVFEDYFDETVKLLRDLDREVSANKKINLVNRHYSLVFRIEKKYLISSDRVRIKSRIPRIHLFISLTAKNGGYVSKSISLGASSGVEYLEYGMLLSEVNRRVKAMENILLEAKPSPRDRMNVVVGSEIAGIIAHEAVGHPFELDRIIGMEGGQAGESYLDYSSINQRIGSKEVYVVDNPRLEGEYGFYIYDDDGIEVDKRVLIKEGYVNTFLSNRFVASRLGIVSNGSSRAANYYHEPLVRMGVTYFEEGSYSLEELLEEAGHGIYIVDYTEWNIDDRRINQRYTGFEAYLIENGEIGVPLKYPVLESTTREILGSIVGRSNMLELYPGSCGKGDPMQPLPVSLGGPHLLLKNVRIRRRGD